MLGPQDSFQGRETPSLLCHGETPGVPGVAGAAWRLRAVMLWKPVEENFDDLSASLASAWALDA